MLDSYSEAIRLIFLNMNWDSDSTVLRLQHQHYAKQIICELYETQIQFWFNLINWGTSLVVHVTTASVMALIVCRPRCHEILFTSCPNCSLQNSPYTSWDFILVILNLGIRGCPEEFWLYDLNHFGNTCDVSDCTARRRIWGFVSLLQVIHFLDKKRIKNSVIRYKRF